MRARNIKPGFFTSSQIVQCEPLARLLFEGLWCEADREGRLKDDLLSLKMKILPADNCEISTLLSQLEGSGLIQRYEVDGNKYIWIKEFLTHQKPHVKEAASTIPAPNKDAKISIQHLPRQVPAPTQPRIYEEKTPSSLIPDSLIPDSREGVVAISADALACHPASSRMDYQKLISIWNETLGEYCPKIQRLTEQRKRLLANRLKDSFDSEPEQWRSYCQAIRGSPFCQGNNDRGWRANIDWALKPQSIARVLEGFYAETEKSLQPTITKTDLALEKVKERYANAV